MNKRLNHINILRPNLPNFFDSIFTFETLAATNPVINSSVTSKTKAKIVKDCRPKDLYITEVTPAIGLRIISKVILKFQ